MELEVTPRFLEHHSERVPPHDLLKQSTWRFITNWYDRQMLICHTNMESMGFSRALNLAVKEKRRYDLIVYDITYGMGCLLHLAYLFEDIPIVGITSGPLNGQNMDLYKDSIFNPAMDPYILSDFGSAMNYWKRIQNVGLYVFDYL